ncbi:MAG: DUF1643 domain-containing protein [Bacteroidota bacterium]
MHIIFEKKDAAFSKNRLHRYCLIRIWDNTKPKVAFVGLNPSTANETNDDPTIRKVIGFAKKWGYGGFYMLNLFTRITPYSKELLHIQLLDKSSDYFLKFFASNSAKIIYCWGKFPIAENRAKEVIQMLGPGYALDINKDGSPRHPLYVPKNAKLIPYGHD